MMVSFLPRVTMIAVILSSIVGCTATTRDSDSGSPLDAPKRIEISGLSVEYPADWYATRQGATVYDGEGILVTSYPLSDRGYVAARENRPPGGVLLMIMDVQPAAEYLADPMVVARPARLGFGGRGSFEGLGDGYRVAFRDNGHAVVVYGAFDEDTEPTERDAAVATLNSISVG